jgi:hypothetical protein
MREEQKFQTTAKLCQEVLGGIVDNILPWNQHTEYLLQDTLAILGSKVIYYYSLTKGSYCVFRI